MLEEYVRLLDGVEDPAKRSRMIKTWAGQLRMDTKQLYRKLKAAGWQSGRRRRRDAGDTEVPSDSLEILAAAMNAAVRQNGKATLYIPTARQILEANGVSFNGASNEHLARLLRARGMDLGTQSKSETAHINMRSLHPNHVHLVDPSLCLLYYLPDKTQGMKRLPKQRQRIIEDSEAYKNKPFMEKKGELKVWRYVLTDHRTGSISVRYYQQPGESMTALWDFLMYAWSPKDEPLYAFHGVPEWLIWDAGSANTSKPIQNALEGLQVKTHVHLPGKPRVKGSVENANNLVETLFESRLRFQPVESVEELNEAAERWAALYNANRIKGVDTRLERRGVKFARLEAWLAIRPEELRELPEEAKELLAYQPETRKVAGDLTITFVHPRIKRRAVYRVGGVPGVRVGATVEVQALLMDDGGALRIRHDWEGQTVTETVYPVEMDELGQPLDAPVWGENYKRNPETYVDLIHKKLDNLTGPGAVPMEGFNDGQGLRAVDAIADEGGAMLPFPRRGEVIDTRREPVVTLNHVEAAKYVMARMGHGWDPAYFAEIKQRFPDGVSERELEALLEELEGGEACAR